MKSDDVDFLSPTFLLLHLPQPLFVRMSLTVSDAPRKLNLWGNSKHWQCPAYVHLPPRTLPCQECLALTVFERNARGRKEWTKQDAQRLLGCFFWWWDADACAGFRSVHLLPSKPEHGSGALPCDSSSLSVELEHVGRERWHRPSIMGSRQLRVERGCTRRTSCSGTSFKMVLLRGFEQSLYSSKPLPRGGFNYRLSLFEINFLLLVLLLS